MHIELFNATDLTTISARSIWDQEARGKEFYILQGRCWLGLTEIGNDWRLTSLVRLTSSANEIITIRAVATRKPGEVRNMFRNSSNLTFTF